MHTKKGSIGLYSVYRPNPKSDPNQIFEYKLIGDKIIIGGDFNLHHDLWGSNKNTKQSRDFVNHLLTTEYKILNNNSPTYRSATTNNESNIDLTLISNNLKSENWKSVCHNKFKFFDHYLIHFKIKLDIKHGYNYRRKAWKLHSKKWPKFTSNLDKNIPKLTQHIQHVSNQCYENKMDKKLHSNLINLLNNTITQTIINTANSTIGKKCFYIGYSPWWNNDIKRIKKQIKQLIRKQKRIRKWFYKSNQNIYQTLQDHPVWNINTIKLKKLRNQKVRLTRKAKRKYARQLNHLIQHPNLHTKKLWKIINGKNFKQSNTIPSLFLDDKKLVQISDSYGKASLIHNHIKNPPSPKYTHENKLFHENIEINNQLDIDNMKQIFSPLSNDTNDILNSKIFGYEIINCSAELKKDKAIGEDQIHNVMLKKISDNFIYKIMVPFFNRCLRFHIFPELWNKANIMPIPKPDKDHRFGTNYRPIAIS